MTNPKNMSSDALHPKGNPQRKPYRHYADGHVYGSVLRMASLLRQTGKLCRDIGALCKLASKTALREKYQKHDPS